MAWKIVATLSVLLLIVAAIAGIARVAWHEENEIHAVETDTIAELTRRSRERNRVELVRAHLAEGQHATFELCADDPMLPARWANAISLTVRPRSSEEGLTFLLDEEVLANVDRSETQGCLIIGDGPIYAEDDYAVEASWETRPEAIERVLLQTRIMSLRRVDDLDLGAVLIGWLGAFLLAIAFALYKPRAIRASMPDASEWEKEEAAARPKIPNEARVAAGFLLFLGAFVGSGFLPPGAALALAISLVLALGECGIAIAFLPGPLRERMSTLGLHAPRRPLLFFPLAIASGVGLWVIALVSTAIVPSTGQAPIQALVSWPSGLVSFAALAVVAPLAEEIFFRGFVYGALETRSRVLAFACAWLLFTVLHASQTWGQWGALVAILLTGLGLTALRALSGSTVVPAIAHLIYNGILAISEVIARA